MVEPPLAVGTRSERIRSMSLRASTGSRIVAAGSSLKLVAVAEGEADLYPRLGTTSQWDIAAGNAILTAAGGRVLDLDGNLLGYGAGKGPAGPHPFLNHWFVATGVVDPFAG